MITGDTTAEIARTPRQEIGTASNPIEIKKAILPEDMEVIIREAPEGGRGALVQIARVVARGLTKPEADNRANREITMGRGPTEVFEQSNGESMVISPFTKGEAFRLSVQDDWVLLQKYDDLRFTRGVPPLTAIKIEDPDLARQTKELMLNDSSVEGKSLTANLTSFIFSTSVVKIPEIEAPSGKNPEPLIAVYEETPVKPQAQPESPIKVEVKPSVQIVEAIPAPAPEPTKPTVEESLEGIDIVTIELSQISKFLGVAAGTKFKTLFNGIETEVSPLVGVNLEEGQLPSIAFGYEVSGIEPHKQPISSPKDFRSIIQAMRAVGLVTEIAKTSGTLDRSWLIAALEVVKNKQPTAFQGRYEREFREDVEKINSKRKVAGQSEIVLDGEKGLVIKAQSQSLDYPELDSIIRIARANGVELDMVELKEIPTDERSELVERIIIEQGLQQ